MSSRWQHSSPNSCLIQRSLVPICHLKPKARLQPNCWQPWIQFTDSPFTQSTFFSVPATGFNKESMNDNPSFGGCYSVVEILKIKNELVLKVLLYLHSAFHVDVSRKFRVELEFEGEFRSQFWAHRWANYELERGFAASQSEKTAERKVHKANLMQEFQN